MYYFLRQNLTENIFNPNQKLYHPFQKYDLKFLT